MLNGVIEETVKYVVAPVLTAATVGVLTYYYCCKKDQANYQKAKSIGDRMQDLRDADYRSKQGVNPARS